MNRNTCMAAAFITCAGGGIWLLTATLPGWGWLFFFAFLILIGW